MAKILFINHEGGGLAREVSITENMTVQDFLDTRIDGDLNEYSVKLNREIVAGSQVLKDGDKLTVLPNKAGGAS